MNAADQLAHFADGHDQPMSGLWYSHNRVNELLQAARAEAWDEGALCRSQVHPSMSVQTLNPYRETSEVTL